MIELMFNFGMDVVFVRIDGVNVYFGNSGQGAVVAQIGNMKLDKAGTIREFPDLAADPEWKEKAIARFKHKIISLPNEKERSNYIIQDLRKHGYVPKLRQQKGFRPEVIH